MIKLEAELKTGAAEALAEALADAAAGEPLVVDGAAVTFLGGRCLQELAIAALSRPEGLLVATPSDAMRRDLATLGADGLFDIEGGAP